MLDSHSKVNFMNSGGQNMQERGKVGGFIIFRVGSGCRLGDRGSAWMMFGG